MVNIKYYQCEITLYMFRVLPQDHFEKESPNTTSPTIPRAGARGGALGMRGWGIGEKFPI
jgi:hypothetical protein